MNLANILADSTSERPEHPAIKLDDTVINYLILQEGAKRIAGLLRERGIESR